MSTESDRIKYSVLMAVYRNDNPAYLKEAIDSMISQTIPPEQYIIVIDGPVCDDINNVVLYYESTKPYLFSVVRLEQNGGLGNALNQGMKKCRNELIARMDADDISLPSRCEKQIDAFEKNPKLSIVGTQINEFVDNCDNVVSARVVPLDKEGIVRFSKRRSPFNHVSVMYKKSVVESFGGYSTFNRKEDLELFVKMVNNGVEGENIDEALVFVRVGDDNMNRRKSWVNCKEYIDIMTDFYKKGYLRISDLAYVVCGQIAMFLLPKYVLKKLNRKYLRSERNK